MGVTGCCSCFWVQEWYARNMCNRLVHKMLNISTVNTCTCTLYIHVYFNDPYVHVHVYTTKLSVDVHVHVCSCLWYRLYAYLFILFCRTTLRPFGSLWTCRLWAKTWKTGYTSPLVTLLPTSDLSSVMPRPTTEKAQ